MTRLALRDCCAWHRSKGPLVAIRPTRRFCSARCRVAYHRAGHYGRQLRAYRVEPIERIEARAFLLKRELLGTTGNASRCFGLRSPSGQVLSVVGFGHGPDTASGDIVLERGATRRRAPHNAASFLISCALRLGGWRLVRAYSDPRFGERGLVFKASGFRQCLPSKHRDRSRYALIERTKVWSDRAIYRRHGSHATARAVGAQLVRLSARVA